MPIMFPKDTTRPSVAAIIIMRSAVAFVHTLLGAILVFFSSRQPGTVASGKELGLTCMVTAVGVLLYGMTFCICGMLFDC